MSEGFRSLLTWPIQLLGPASVVVNFIQLAVPLAVALAIAAVILAWNNTLQICNIGFLSPICPAEFL